MEVQEQIKKFGEFIDSFSKAQLVERIKKDEKFLFFDFSELIKFEPELADQLLDQPEEIIKAAEIAIEQFDMLGEVKNFKARFINLPKTQKMMIRNIRSKHLDKILMVEGTVRQKSDVRPQVISARFECPTDNTIINVLQLDNKFREPQRCHACGRKGKFILLSKELVDAQGIVLEESSEDLEGGEQPKRINILLKNDLVSPISEKKTNPGSKIRVVGILKEVPILAKDGGKLTRFDLMVEVNSIESIEEDFTTIEISPEEEKEILELAQDPKLHEKLVNSVVPSIYGHEMIKEAILMQMVGGVRKVRDDGSITRGDMHILLIGDPGAGKSAMLKRVAKIAPKGRFVSGKGASGAGLTAAVVKDEFMSGWSLEAGALVLGNRGICCTTEDTEVILEDYRKITFKELFQHNDKTFLYPDFSILALNTATNKIEPFKIRRAFKIKNDKRVYALKTRTGKEIKLTEDNEVLVIRDSEEKWVKVSELTKRDYIATPNSFPLEGKDNYTEDFSYICGLIATDGHIKINSKNAQTSFYNANEGLVAVCKNKLTKLGIKYSIFIQHSGRTSFIRGKKVETKQNVYRVYNSQKYFAKKVIDFGIPSGNKSSEKALEKKILGYSRKTLSAFMAGVFDGDGCIRKNPSEISITTGLLNNAKLYQEIFLRLGIISTVEKSSHSWHCSVRGQNECIKFSKNIRCCHPEKCRKLGLIGKTEMKDRINVLPNHQKFFKTLLKKYRWKLGKNVFRYFWNYTKKGVAPSKYRLTELNKLIRDKELERKIRNHILWDKIRSIKKTQEEFVYDFTMQSTNNFVANNIIMHNCIDELDKMSEEDRDAMHEALEGQTVTISKANIQATLRAETTVLAAANPKFGRFDPYEMIPKQIDLPSTLINRFDLIFPVRDLPNKDKDDRLATFVLNLHQSPDMVIPELESKKLRKYFAYARQRSFPKLTDGAIEEIKKYYLKMRGSGSEEGQIKSIPISARQLEALVRMSEACAKLSLGIEVTRKDAKKAIDLMHYCLVQVGLDPETGQIDIDRISTGISASERSHITVIKEIIAELERKVGKIIPLDDLIDIAKQKGIESDVLEETIQKLKRSGDIFEPKRGSISKL